MIVSMCAGWELEKDGVADYARYLAEELGGKGLEARKVPLGLYIDDGAYYDRAARNVSGSDICHVQFNYSYFNGELPYRNRFVRFASGVKAPIVMTVHEVRLGFELMRSGFRGNMQRAIFNCTIPLWNLWSKAMHKGIYGAAERIIVHTEAHAEKVRRFVRNPDKVVLIPHGIPHILKADKELSQGEAKKRLDLEGKRVLTILGFIGKRKGYETVLDALPGLPEDVVLLIAGGMLQGGAADTDYYNRLIGYIAAKRLSSRVRITGYLGPKDIPVVMAATDISVAPFLSTAASGALALCIGYNKPIAASDIPVHREINARTPCLELFRQEHSLDLSKKLTAIFDSPNLARALSASTAVYGEKYSYGAVSDMLIKLYEGVISKAAARLKGSAGGTA